MIGEFQMLEEYTNKNKGEATEAVTEQNKPLNRYPNILPNDKNRVKLDTCGGAYESDYINASFLDGPDGSEKYYICTQGPLPTTCGDFWRMVWDHKVTNILMLTQCWENDRIKCHRYWPENQDQDKTYGKFTVNPVSEEDDKKNKLKIRKFQVMNELAPNETRDVTQYQYLGWKDHEVPEDISSIIHLGNIVAQSKKENPAPFVVHCSAGIGRTGTFCVMHNILTQVEKAIKGGQKSGFEFSIPEEIVKMRSQRSGIIQTKEQYLYTYEGIHKGSRTLGLELAPLKEKKKEENKDKKGK